MIDCFWVVHMQIIGTAQRYKVYQSSKPKRKLLYYDQPPTAVPDAHTSVSVCSCAVLSQSINQL